MPQLSVNLNKVALLRNSRTLDVPSVLRAARICIEAGAAGITVHPRPDERHIRVTDVDALADMVSVEFNIEGNPFHNLMDIVRKVRPDQATLVPDDPNALTSNQGWDIAADGERLKPIISELKDLGCRVSLFMDPDIEQIERIPESGADRIELYTEPYAAAFEEGPEALDRVLPSFVAAAESASDRLGR